MRVREVTAADPSVLPDQVRAAAEDATSVLVRIDEGGDPLARAQLLASVGPLAVALAPAVRVNALLIAVDADPASVEQAARWLGGTPSTTGQLLRISPRA